VNYQAMPTRSHLDPEAIRSSLRTAKYHVARARQIVAEQRRRIARLHDRGHSIQSHEAMLAQFEQTLAALEHHERHLHAELAEAKQRS